VVTFKATPTVQKKGLERGVGGGEQGCQIFLSTTYQNGRNMPNDQKIYQRAIKYIQLLYNIPNGLKRNQHFPFPGVPKCTKIDIFCLKRNRLAALVGRDRKHTKNFFVLNITASWLAMIIYRR
jgi:hypothetical protein